jgi:hypothetical protein
MSNLPPQPDDPPVDSFQSTQDGAPEEVPPHQLSSLATSIYSPLNSEPQEIRLLSILPVSNDCEWESIKCHLHQIRLKDLRNELNYIALSYTWGDPVVRVPITVNGKTMQVTANLESALRHLRVKFGPVFHFWIDAICINQFDVSERSHQVELMSEIYSVAEFVLIWLGESNDDAMDIIAETSKLIELLQQIEDGSLRTFDDEDLGPLSSHRAWDVLDRFWDRPWWSRIWTFQELVLGKSVAILCGLQLLPWDCLSEWILVIQRLCVTSNKLPVQFGDLIPLKTAFKKMRNAGVRAVFKKLHENPLGAHEYQLLSLLQMVRSHQATDPLDFIYGLFGLALDSSDFPKPDYTLSVAEVYTQATLTWIQRDNSMSFLADCSVQGALEIPGLPSWVPNWARSGESSLFPRPYKDYSAAGKTEAFLKICSEMPGCLQVFGLPQCTISYVESFNILEVYSNEAKATPIVLQTWSVNDIEDVQSTTPKLQQYFRTLMFDWDPVIDTRLSPLNSSFFDLLCGFILLLFLLRGKDEISFSSDVSKLLDLVTSSEIVNGGHCPTLAQAFIGMPQESTTVEWLGDMNIFARGMDWLEQVMDRWRNHNGMVLFLGEDGNMGMGPQDMRPGDVVAVFFGHPVPVVLRSSEDNYLFVGECFAFGLMDGEAIQEYEYGNTEAKAFYII